MSGQETLKARLAREIALTGPMSVEGSAGSPSTWAARAPFSPSIRASAESCGT